MRKAKDSQEFETFQKRAILFYKIGKWLKHKIELKDKPEKRRTWKISVDQILSGWNPRKGKSKDFREVAGILIFEISNLLDSEPQLFFSSINFEGATMGDCFQMRMILIRI